MFKCGRCHKISKAGERPTKLVVETRERDYHTEDGITHGSEIVKEITICGKCEEKVNA